MVRSKPLTQEKKPVPKARIFFLFFIFYNLPSHLTRTSPKPTPIQVCNPSIRTGTAWKPGIGVLRTKTSFTKSSFANPKTAPTPRKKKKKKKAPARARICAPHRSTCPQPHAGHRRGRTSCPVGTREPGPRSAGPRSPQRPPLQATHVRGSLNQFAPPTAPAHRGFEPPA